MAGLTAKKPVVPNDFADVQLALKMGWDYWQIRAQPSEFLERLYIYIEAERVAETIIAERNKRGIDG